MKNNEEESGLFSNDFEDGLFADEEIYTGLFPLDENGKIQITIKIK